MCTALTICQNANDITFQFTHQPSCGNMYSGGKKEPPLTTLTNWREMAKHTEFSRAWRWRFSTRKAAAERKLLKRTNARYNRRQRKLNANHIEIAPNAWDVI